MQDRALGRAPQQQALTWGQWGEYTRSVVTTVMPARFIDEVCAHITSALAVAAFKGLVRTENRRLDLLQISDFSHSNSSNIYGLIFSTEFN